MPLYVFGYTDENGDEFEFDEFVSLADMEAGKKVMSPCGNYEAARVFTPFSIGAEGPTRREKEAFVGGKKTLSERRELSSHVREMRDIRKKAADPNSRAAKTNEFWTGSEDVGGVVRRKLPDAPQYKLAPKKTA